MEYMDLYRIAVDKVGEELHDAQSYAMLAAKNKGEPSVCKLFLKLSQAEIEHADWLKKEAQNMIANAGAKNADADKMRTIWDVKVDDWAEEELEVKLVTAMVER